MFVGAGPCAASEVRSSICVIASDFIFSLDYIRTHGNCPCHCMGISMLMSMSRNRWP